MIIRFFGILFLLHLAYIGQTQVGVSPSAEQMRAEIEKRGYNTSMVEDRMNARGFELGSLPPDQMAAAQSALSEVLKELDAEKSRTGSPVIPGNQGTPISPATGQLPSVNLETNLAPPEPPAIVQPIASSIYGQQIFRDKKLGIYNQVQVESTPEGYMLGPGDKIVVSIWGTSANYNEQMEVNAEGYVTPKNLSRVYLAGLTFAKARQQLRAAFNQRYPVDGSNFEVTLAFARAITVNVTGEVTTYGSYSLSALNTAFHALVAAGGPSDIGSVRNIMLYRAGEAPRLIDVYEYLLNPLLSNSFYLNSHDNLFVPVAERTVTLLGEVKRPFKYELTKDEQLSQLLKWAGGLTDAAYTQNIQIVRISDQKRVVIDIDWKKNVETGQDVTLLSGDIVTVRTISSPVENLVFADGAVEYEGQYAFTPGMRLTELLGQVRPLKQSRKDFAYLLRQKPDGTLEYISANIGAATANPNAAQNLLLKEGDKLRIFTQSQFVDNAKLSSEGALRNPTDIPYDFNRTIKVTDLLELSGGLRPDATDFGYIERIFPDKPKDKVYIRVNLTEALSNPKGASNLQLEPFDRLRVYSKGLYKDELTVSVGGGVRVPGSYQYSETLTLSDVITMAGGFQFGAASNRVDVFRLVIDKNQPTKTTVATYEVDEQFNIASGQDLKLQPFDIVEVRFVPEFEMQQIVQIQGEVKFPGAYALTGKKQKITDVLQQAGGLAPEAFPSGATLYRTKDDAGLVVIHLDRILKNPNDRENFYLKAGDRLLIPKSKDFVTITGETRANELYLEVNTNQGLKVAYYPGRRANYYIYQYAGGFGNRAKIGDVTVKHANGQIERTQNLLLFRIYPKVRNGSTILVNAKSEKPPKQERKKKEIDWDKKFTQILAFSTAFSQILVTYLLFTRD